MNFTRLRAAAPGALFSAGLAFAAAAGWVWNPIAGLAATGVALCVIGFGLADGR